MASWWLLILASCEPVPTRAIDEMTFPAGFRLDASAEVALTVDAPSGSTDRLVVRTPDGQTLYDGGVALASRRGLRLRVAEPTRDLEASVRRDGQVVVVVTVPIEGGRAALSLGDR